MSARPIRIGFCTDLSGPYQEVDGPGGATAIELAISDFGGTIAGRSIELVRGDHRNDPAVARQLAERWYGEDAIDAVIGGVNSDTSLAITGVAAARGGLVLVVGAGTTVQTRERASPTVIQYAYDTAALATAPGRLLAQRGDRRWFYITADYPFGRELETHGRTAVAAAGGTTVGSVLNPHEADDFTPYVQAALDSGAQVLGLANGHAELIKAMTAMRALGVGERMKLVGLLTFIDDIHAMGLDQAQGLYLADSWYWTRDAASRAWAERFNAAQGRMPSSLQAADYSAATQFLRAAAATGSTEPQAVAAQLRGAPLSDMYVTDGCIRTDGTMLHEMYLLQVKSPDRSSSPWDVYDLVGVVSAEEAFPGDRGPT